MFATPRTKNTITLDVVSKSPITMTTKKSVNYKKIYYQIPCKFRNIENTLRSQSNQLKKVNQQDRCMVQSTPYRRMQNLVISLLVTGVVKYLNGFPYNTGISETMRPQVIIEG